MRNYASTFSIVLVQSIYTFLTGCVGVITALAIMAVLIRGVLSITT